jgi:P4 family phage/plasmid primase-like protien
MNISMTSTSQFTDLNEFLAKHSAKNQKGLVSTHTRIPDASLNIYPGAFVIPKEELPLFHGLYYESIFVKKRKEYLTEKQTEHGGTMAVDFDFRYNYDVDTRQHTKEHIQDMILLYLEELKEYFTFEEEKPFNIFIFEKPNVNRLTDGSLTKDGIHMIIGCQVDYTMQMMIREKMLEKLPEIWDLPFINNYESVLDDGISKGTTNWQLFGSRKPGNEAYELTQHFVISYDSSDGEFMMSELKVTDFDMKNNFSKLSVQYDSNPKFEINPKIIDAYNKRLENKGNKIKKPNSKTKMKLLVDDDCEEPDEDYISINDINNREILDRALNNVFKKLKQNEYEIRETHEFAQALPEKYYKSGSHLLNRQVAFALKHTDDRLFLSWIKLRSKADDFDFNDIPNKWVEWKKIHRTNQSNECVTKRSIMYWLKKENFDEYEKIKKQTIDYYIEKALETSTEYDLAEVLKQMYKDKYVCLSYKKNTWYVFKNHRWVLDEGLSLRERISKDMYDLFSVKCEQVGNEVFEYTEDDTRREYLKKKSKVIGEIKIKLKKTNDKNNIMREAAEIFYDGEFIKNMDTNKYLLCFNNGVVDFKNKTFREGYPEDYITMTTRINYVPYDEKDTEFKSKSEAITDFMDKLFPILDLNRYMWEHLASCLIGSNKNQTFNVYHGSGSNGKSILADMMSLTLGEYKGTVPITLVTEKRGLIGGTSDEVLKLKGKRYAVMQEPSKGVKLNEGIMKELTGGDPIQARGLYSESEIFEPQFNLVVCTNNLFDIESNDDGTWRRIRKCDFVSKFVDNGETYSDDVNPDWVYPKDKDLKDKLPSLAPTFASMLVNIAFKTEGVVIDCETVTKASSKYRNCQDHIAAFVSENIMKTNEQKDRVKKTEISQQFKIWFQESQGSRKIPKGEELYAYMDKKFGASKKSGWHGIKMKYPENEDEVEEEDAIDMLH